MHLTRNPAGLSDKCTLADKMDESLKNPASFTRVFKIFFLLYYFFSLGVVLTFFTNDG